MIVNVIRFLIFLVIVLLPIILYNYTKEKVRGGIRPTLIISAHGGISPHSAALRFGHGREGLSFIIPSGIRLITLTNIGKSCSDVWARTVSTPDRRYRFIDSLEKLPNNISKEGMERFLEAHGIYPTDGNRPTIYKSNSRFLDYTIDFNVVFPANRYSHSGIIDRPMNPDDILSKKIPEGMTKESDEFLSEMLKYNDPSYIKTEEIKGRILRNKSYKLSEVIRRIHDTGFEGDIILFICLSNSLNLTSLEMTREEANKRDLQVDSLGNVTTPSWEYEMREDAMIERQIPRDIPPREEFGDSLPRDLSGVFYHGEPYRHEHFPQLLERAEPYKRRRNPKPPEGSFIRDYKTIIPMNVFRNATFIDNVKSSVILSPEEKSALTRNQSGVGISSQDMEYLYDIYVAETKNEDKSFVQRIIHESLSIPPSQA